MTRPIFVQDIPDGPFSFSDLECELVTIDGDIFERATVPRDRVGDLVMGEEIQGSTNFRMEARKGDREVLSWIREWWRWGVHVGCGRPPRFMTLAGPNRCAIPLGSYSCHSSRTSWSTTAPMALTFSLHLHWPKCRLTRRWLTPPRNVGVNTASRCTTSRRSRPWLVSSARSCLILLTHPTCVRGSRSLGARPSQKPLREACGTAMT